MAYKVLDMQYAKVSVHQYWDSKMFTQEKMIEIVMKWTAYYIDDRLKIVEYVKTLNK
jgi:hypothetical protein